MRIVDSAATTAQAVAREMTLPPAATPYRGRVHGGRIRWLATDDAERFARVGGRFFGAELHAEAVEIIDL